MSSSSVLRTARQSAGLTQVQLARRAGVTQSMISAYENGHRDPTFSTLDRLLRATGHRLTFEPIGDSEPESSTLLQLRRRRDDIVTLLARGGAHHPRVFGSAARGGDDPNRSDVDVMVDLEPDVSIVQLIRLERELSELIGRPVDLVPADMLKSTVREAALAESVPL